MRWWEVTNNDCRLGEWCELLLTKSWYDMMKLSYIRWWKSVMSWSLMSLLIYCITDPFKYLSLVYYDCIKSDIVWFLLFDLLYEVKLRFMLGGHIWFNKVV